MSEITCYVRADPDGAMRVGNTRVLLDSVVAAFEQGHSPETIQQQYPALTLEEVYGAITWYLAHAEEAHQYLARQDQLWNDWREKSRRLGSPISERLRAAKQSATARPK